jgi:hypothetical protein
MRKKKHGQVSRFCISVVSVTIYLGILTICKASVDHYSYT